jgi:type IV secretion system protein VirD4
MTDVTPMIKKHVIPNLPYALIFWFACKLGEAYRLAPGNDALQKIIRIAGPLNAAMAKPMPSFALFDLAVGLAGAALVYGVVYFRKKNAKKFRKNEEYGSACWGA